MISTQLDDFILNKDSTIWVAALSDGRKVYQDDDRPDYDPTSAWLRLQRYVETNKECIMMTGLALQFRDHIIHLPDNQSGYYFSKGIKARPEVSKQHYVVGYLKDKKWWLEWYMVPELIVSGTNVIDWYDAKQKFTIYNNVVR